MDPTGASYLVLAQEADFLTSYFHAQELQIVRRSFNRLVTSLTAKFYFSPTGSGLGMMRGP
jgi:hypothetical protein